MMEFELLNDHHTVNTAATQRTGQEFLLAYPSGAYTTMRTVGRWKIFDLETHQKRIVDTLRSLTTAGRIPSVVHISNLLHHAIHSEQIGKDVKELKITLLAFYDNNEEGGLDRPRLIAHVCPLPSAAEGGVTVEIHGRVRSDANAKNSQWVRDREECAKQQHSESNEVLLYSAETLDVYEGKSSNFFAVDMSGVIYTAPLDSVLVGTMLKLVLDCCKLLKYQVRFQFPNLQSINNWQAAFITSTSRILFPIDCLWLPTGQDSVTLESSSNEIVKSLLALMTEQMKQKSTEPKLETDEKSVALQRYLKLDRQEKTRNEIVALHRRDPDSADLTDRLLNTLTFGTAGLRAAMGAGFSRMNCLTVIQATQGLCEYLLKTFGDNTGVAQQRGVVIGHDHRHNSEDFARVTAAVFLSKNVKVYYFKQLVHTPSVPFAIKHYGALCGIMITASHNPKDDNGYKLYWENASQVIPPHDKHIQSAIERNQEPWTWDLTAVDRSPLVCQIPSSLFDEYYKQIADCLSPLKASTSGAPVEIVYSAMHGVGSPFARRVMETLQLPQFHEVEEQRLADPDFPTVKYPNPEEGAGALELSIRLANQIGASIILANDPDADRLAVAERASEDGSWSILTGNEMGTILGYFIFSKCQKQFDVSKIAMLASAVSSKFLLKLATVEGFRFEETLTGFKWIGNRALELERQGFKVLFGFEEAIGFMIDTIVPDKDGISALGCLSLVIHHVYTQGMNLRGYLETIYQRYGYFYTINSYYFSHSPAVTRSIFDRIRNYYATSCDTSDNQSTNNTYPKCIGVFRVDAVRDLTTGYDSTQPDCKAKLPTSKSSQMITFQVSHHSFTASLTLRTSGTEPKIKYYSEMTVDYDRRLEIEGMLSQLIKSVAEELLEPEKNGLVPKSL